MLTRALAPLFDALNSTLEPHGFFAFEVHSVVSRLDLVPGFAPDTTALHVPFTLDIGEQLASFSLAIPASVLEPLRGKLGVAASEASCSRDMPKLVAEVPVSISVALGHTEMTLRQLLRLQPGTVLALSQGRNDELPVSVEGVVKFHATPVQQDGMVAVEITRRNQ
jgi:flagellar motor switch protein FliM